MCIVRRLSLTQAVRDGRGLQELLTPAAGLGSMSSAPAGERWSQVTSTRWLPKINRLENREDATRYHGAHRVLAS